MRGIAFTTEAIVAILVLLVFSSTFLTFVDNQDHMLSHRVMAMDVANLASEVNFWARGVEYQQEKATLWSQMLGFCIILEKENQTIKSETCGKASKSEKITTNRVYFDRKTGQMGVFTVSISPPG